MQPIYKSDFSESLHHQTSLPSLQPSLQTSLVISVPKVLFVTEFSIKFGKAH